MPSKTPKQARFMRAVAHNPDFASKVGVPMKVGKEFTQSDKRAMALSRALRGKKRTNETDFMP